MDGEKDLELEVTVCDLALSVDAVKSDCDFGEKIDHSSHDGEQVKVSENYFSVVVELDDFFRD